MTLDVLVADITAEFPRFRLIRKDESRFMRVLARIVFWARGFATVYTTTIGYRVYMPSSVMDDPVQAVNVLRHERIHLRQFDRHPVWYPVSYLFLLPAFVTVRARWELEAYVETMREELDRTGDVSDETIDSIVPRFTGADYLFMDVRGARVRRRLNVARERLLLERDKGVPDA